jgi:hypothetical protein
MEYPLNLSFKIMALAPQIYVRDAGGELRMYVKQKLMKLKEAVTVFADEKQTRPLYTINADRVIDFSAKYNFATADGRPLGFVQRQGMASIWRARYEIHGPDGLLFRIREENPWTKVIDRFIGEIPLIGLLSGYLFHPAYAVERPDGSGVMRAVKQPAFLEGRFKIEKQTELATADEGLAVLSLLMMLLLERRRG